MSMLVITRWYIIYLLHVILLFLLNVYLYMGIFTVDSFIYQKMSLEKLENSGDTTASLTLRGVDKKHAP